MARAKRCPQCGSKLFPTDTFCGICGADVTEVNGTGAAGFSSAADRTRDVYEHSEEASSKVNTFKPYDDAQNGGFANLEQGPSGFSEEDLLAFDGGLSFSGAPADVSENENVSVGAAVSLDEGFPAAADSGAEYEDELPTLDFDDMLFGEDDSSPAEAFEEPVEESEDYEESFPEESVVEYDAFEDQDEPTEEFEAGFEEDIEEPAENIEDDSADDIEETSEDYEESSPEESAEEYDAFEDQDEPTEEFEAGFEEDIEASEEDVEAGFEEDIEAPEEDIEAGFEEDLEEPEEDIEAGFEEDIEEPAENTEDALADDIEETSEDYEDSFPEEPAVEYDAFEDQDEPAEDVEAGFEEDIEAPEEDIEAGFEEDLEEPAENTEDALADDFEETSEDYKESFPEESAEKNDAFEDQDELAEDVEAGFEEDLEESSENTEDALADDIEETSENLAEEPAEPARVLAAAAPEKDPDSPSEYTSELSRLEAQLAEAEAEVQRLEKESKDAEREASIAAYKAEGDSDESADADSDSDEAIWEESEKRAEQAQKDFERQQHRQLIKEGGAHYKRDIVLLIAGIAVLAIVLGWLVHGSFKDIPGNDAYKEKAPEVVVKTETYVPSDMGGAWDGSVAEGLVNGTGTEADPYIISAGSELAYIASQTNRGVTFEGTYFKLNNDIDLNKLEWTPAGYYYEDADGEKIIAFSGILNGDGHKITGLNISDITGVRALDGCSANIAVGLFGALNKATITGLTIEDATIVAGNDAGSLYAGALAGYMGESTVSSCSASAAITAKGNERTAAGLFAGAVMGGTVTEATVSGTVNCLEAPGTADVGGFTGYTATSVFDKLNITASLNVTGVLDVYAGGVSGYSDSIDTKASVITVSASLSTTGEQNAAMGGGISGAAHTGSDGDNTVNATLTVSATKSAYSGGLYGYAENVTTTGGTAAADQNTIVTAADSRVAAGGACGSASEYRIDGTVISGTVTTAGTVSNSTGGILGFSANGTVSNANTTVVTNASASAGNASVMAGGIAGEINGGTYTDDAASGKINVTSAYNGYAGGAFGYINGGTFTNVNVNGAITNTSTNGVTSGGLCGYADGTMNFTDCTGSKSRTNSGQNVYDSDTIAFDATK